MDVRYSNVDMGVTCTERPVTRGRIEGAAIASPVNIPFKECPAQSDSPP